MVKHQRLGLRMKDFENKKDYLERVKLMKKHNEQNNFREFYKKQVNGTIFAHEGTEGDIL